MVRWLRASLRSTACGSASPQIPLLDRSYVLFDLLVETLVRAIAATADLRELALRLHALLSSLKRHVLYQRREVLTMHAPCRLAGFYAMTAVKVRT